MLCRCAAHSPTKMAALLTPALLRRLEQFQLLARRRAKSSLKAERRSKGRGQSVELADSRTYVSDHDFLYLDCTLCGLLEFHFVNLYDVGRDFAVTAFLASS